jgi:Protein of unknown function (DUF3631)
MTSPVESLVQRLNARRSGQGWKAKCPAHEDHTPSLSICEGDDGCALIHCHAGCSTDDVLAALGMSKRDLFPPTSHQSPKTPTPAKSAEAVPASAPQVQPRPLGQLLDAIIGFLRRYVVFQHPEQAIVCALWSVHTWFFESFDYTPYLHIFSAEKRSGKTRLLDCLALLVKEPWRAVSPSEAVLYRRVDRLKPTLLLDEVDTIFSNTRNDRGEYIRSLLNAGFENGAKVPRCVGKSADITDQDFGVFCPKALCGIGKVLHDTVDDRCLKIELVRQARDERVERFRKRKAKAVVADIKAELEALAKQLELKDTLSNAEPALPDELQDRQQDVAEPLLAIADVAGGKWPESARAALIAVCRQEEDASKGVQLLAAMRDIFDTTGDKVPTREAVERLVAIEEGPWALMFEDALKHDKLSTAAARLAKLLKPYKIKPRTIKLDNEATAKGYHRSDFESDWKRYLPASPSLSPEAVTSVTTVTCEGKKVTASRRVTALQDEAVTQISLVAGQKVTAVTAVTPFRDMEGKWQRTVKGERFTDEDDREWFKYPHGMLCKDAELPAEYFEPFGKLVYPGGMVQRRAEDGWPTVADVRCRRWGCGKSLANEPYYWEHYKRPILVRCGDCQEAKWLACGYEVESGLPSSWLREDASVKERKAELARHDRWQAEEGLRWLQTEKGKQWLEAANRRYEELEAKNRLKKGGMTPGQFLTEARKLFNAVPINDGGAVGQMVYEMNERKPNEN